MLLATVVCTADFIAVGSVLWTTVLTAMQAAIAIPWAWTVVSMDYAESRILDSKRFGRFRRVASHAVTFAALGAVLAAKVIVIHRSPADAAWVLKSAYLHYVVFAFVLFIAGLLGRGSRLARFLGSIADHPARLMAISFAVVALLGGFLLTLPLCVRNVGDANFVNGLFTATSAVCVTGLAVNDIAVTYTFAGQVVIFLLIQAGGLGIMVLSAAVAIFAGRRLQTRSTAALTEMIDAESFAKLRRTIRHIFLFTVVTEFIGAVFLFFSFLSNSSVDKGWRNPDPAAGAANRVWSAVFHSVSAFCNAGFSLCHGNLISFTGSFGVSGTIALLITMGGLGFPVLDELWGRWKERKNPVPSRRLSLHSRVVLWMSAALVFVGTMAYLVLEWNGTLRELSFIDALIASVFQSVSTRTAGFNSLDFSKMGQPIIVFTCFLMFIGASPASTGGGIKTTTFAVLLSVFRAEMRGAKAPKVFDRAISDSTARRAVAVVVGSVLIVGLGWFALLLTESHDALRLLFETVSAFATCGLSTGITGQLTDPGKLIVVLMMFVGRIGPVTLALSLAAKPRVEHFGLPEEKVLIG
ncbi:MAG: TrkH family potassium uptake protein [Planctomycetes bacterium]|nr:TrkH family potassium uptake protein [Planctomycetota bacterium]